MWWMLSNEAFDEDHLAAYELETTQFERYIKGGKDPRFFEDPFEVSQLRRIRMLRGQSVTYNRNHLRS
jgi:hypothetical protein